MALSPRWRAMREGSRGPGHDAAGVASFHYGGGVGAAEAGEAKRGGGGSYGVHSNLAGQTFGEAYASFHTEGTVASQRHGCVLLAPHLHLPERSSSIYDKTVNLREAELPGRLGYFASNNPPSSLAKPMTPRQSSIPFTPQPRTPSSGQGRNVSFSEPVSAPASAYAYGLSAPTARAGSTPPAVAPPYRRASSLGPVPALPTGALTGRRDGPSEPTSFVGLEPRSSGEGASAVAAGVTAVGGHFSPLQALGSTAGSRSAAFSRLHDFLLRTHISSLLSALAEDGWLLPRERDVLNSRAREESRVWSGSFNRAYIRFLETDNVQVFVSDLRVLLV
mmetsp:Transcript_65621/g.137161  ORF Transcript_65621/g.137161 Transcript_65621/m.137161 type:complete len:334 (+) Transcript_65621:354-1355(+)|eukprot:CAMPEP_0206431276 /NCGR_PEP_ID=MMETSP0324_2-20121206/7274_1 /ASSEMBLY_ACC=CAM_ASM_000836 /TAXON_ID=2866 /ORGANISM="Crypthecodinium cohnii, Strain Seligo" /LENGTH=333 /DNA_ID=CAMNT_0053897185 /DNA_START=269 /DNA_END=1270 /DNA_ORIENTATION=-